MANTHETIAEIRVETEAEFRKLIDLWITQTKSTAIEPCERLQAMQKFNNYFDRLEAAIKRERAKIEADALEVGGIVEAAHRLELSKNASKNGADFGQLGDAAKLREAVDESRRIAQDLCGCRLNDYWKLNEIVRVCEAAPPRNCDRPKCATTKAAQDVWRREDGGKTAYYEWLLAPATEGGAE